MYRLGQTPQPNPTARIAGLVAAISAVAFALGHYAWAAGLTVLGATDEQFDKIDQGSAEHLVTEIAVGSFAIVAAFVALALVLPWGAAIPRWIRRSAAVLGAVLAGASAVYGVGGIALQLLAALDRYEFPEGHEMTAAGWWFFWYLLFAVMGTAFVTTAWLTRRHP